MCQNSSDSKRTIHLDRRAHFCRNLVDEGTLNLEYCPTKLMEADYLTKILAKPLFEDLRLLSGLTYKYAVDAAPRIMDALVNNSGAIK